jgi:hypothetical protein
MLGPDPDTQLLIRRLEEERLARRLALARVLRAGQPERPSLDVRLAAGLGDALIALGRWLVERAGRSTCAGPASSIG